MGGDLRASSAHVPWRAWCPWRSWLRAWTRGPSPSRSRSTPWPGGSSPSRRRSMTWPDASLPFSRWSMLWPSGSSPASRWSAPWPACGPLRLRSFGAGLAGGRGRRNILRTRLREPHHRGARHGHGPLDHTGYAEQSGTGVRRDTPCMRRDDPDGVQNTVDDPLDPVCPGDPLDCCRHPLHGVRQCLLNGMLHLCVP